MASSYEQEEGLDPFAACDREVIPAERDNMYQRYYDEQMRAMDAQRQAEEKAEKDAAFKEKFGFDRNDPDIIDVVDDPAEEARKAGDAVQARDANATAVALPKNIFYAVDFHMPAGMELGYDGRGANRMDGRRNGRLGHGGQGRLGFGESANEEDAIVLGQTEKKPMTSKEISKEIGDLFRICKITPETPVAVRYKNNFRKVIAVYGESGGLVRMLADEKSSKSMTIQDLVTRLGNYGYAKMSSVSRLYVEPFEERGKKLDIVGVDCSNHVLVFEVSDVETERNRRENERKVRAVFDSEEIDEGTIHDKFWKGDQHDRNAELRNDAFGADPDDDDAVLDQDTADEIADIRAKNAEAELNDAGYGPEEDDEDPANESIPQDYADYCRTLIAD